MPYPASVLAGSIYKVFNQDWLTHCTQIIGAACDLICLALWTPHMVLASAHHFILDFGSTTYNLIYLSTATLDLGSTTYVLVQFDLWLSYPC